MKNTVRLTIDFPLEQHFYLKMLALKENISLKEFVTRHLPAPVIDQNKSREDNFNSLMNELMSDYSNMLKNLAVR